MFYAWKTFSKGKRSKRDVIEFQLRLEENIFDLNHSLISGTWKPDPYVAFYVQDPKLRRIHKATVRDRVLYQSLYQVLYKIFDKSFVYDSFASRNKKGTHKGLERFQMFSKSITQNYIKPAFVLKCDIRKFFDSIDHNTLIYLIQKKVQDENLVLLIIKVIDSFHTIKGKGLPLGNVTSQIMANIYLNELDQFCKHKLKLKYYIRYCDDFVILHEDLIFLKDLIIGIQSFLLNNLKIQLHPNKISIRKIHSGIDFLGYVSLPNYKVLRTKTKIRIFKKIEKLKQLFYKKEISEELLKQSVQSYLGILSHCKGARVKIAIENILCD